MNSPNRHRLLEDALFSVALTESLTATRRAARHRRMRRRTIRAAAVVCVVISSAWIFFPADNTPHKSPPVAHSAKPPPFVLVTNGPEQSSVFVRTAAAPASLIVTTRTAPAPVSTASRDDLFASAGSRPGGLIQFADGTSRWMWLDLPELY